jgi:hypothetical protein
MLERQVCFNAALTPDPERLNDGSEFASRWGQLIFEDAAVGT